MSLFAKPFRAWDLFRLSLGFSFIAFVVFLLVSMGLNAWHGDLTARESNTLLRMLYWGTYPLVFVALGALTWHFIQYYRGAYAGR